MATSNDTDTELLRQAALGRPRAFEELVARHGRYLRGIARALVGTAFDAADDVVQETLLAALNAAARFRGESSVRTWLVKILVRQAALERRNRQRRGRWMVALDESPPPASPDPAAAADARLDLPLLLAELPPEQRDVVVLREMEGLSYDEIAAALEIPRGTVESRLFRAREALRRRFGN